ncbi:hypothetical protein ccbrp13_66560 [Ktedonobacteria bacterium brp13]|nr:hypothetical protein ccbrp13_66560 [Ktedonobacteria bacterium brp13]
MPFPSELPPGASQKHTAYQNESAAPYKAYLFGPFRITLGNQQVGTLIWRRNKAKTLLKWFLLNPSRMFSADQLIELFWPGVERTSGLRNLHVTINYLRHLLEPDLLPHQESSFICRNKNNFYWFEMNDQWWADIFAVQYHETCAVNAEQRENMAEVIVHQHKIVEYCSLGFLPADTYEDIFSPYRRKYDCLYQQTLEHLIHHCTQSGMFDEVFSYSQQALLLDPYCEVAIKAVVHVYFQQGNVAGAMRKLKDFQNLLKDDLGLEIGEDLQLLQKRYLK